MIRHLAIPNALRVVTGEAGRLRNGWNEALGVMAMRFLAVAWLVFLSGLGNRVAQAQEAGAVTGNVVSTWDVSPIPGVIVTVRGTTLATKTDNSGRFLLNGVPAGDQVLRFTKAGFASLVVTDVRVLMGQTNVVNANLRPEFYELEEYVVTAEELVTQDTALRLERQQSANFMESISADRFSRLGAGDASEIMTKITGVSVVGKFAVVRGLSDRYNMTLLNGGEVPTSDPYSRSVQLDLFPSDLIENVVVNKTFTPDLPGGFGGAAMDIITKSFPEKFIFKASVGIGYNNQSTFNEDYLTYKGGGLDAFGMDDGTRELPGELAGIDGTELQRLLATASSGSRNTPQSAKAAASAELYRLTHSFGSREMGPKREAPPIDHDFSFLVGDTLKLGERPLGYFASLNYERDYRYSDNAVRSRYNPGSNTDPTPVLTEDYESDFSETKAQWSSLVNLAYQIAEEHEVGFNFLYSQVGEDNARKMVGRITTSSLDQLAPGSTQRTHRDTLYYLERNLTSYQLKGNHVIDSLNRLGVDWLGSIASAYQDEPDLRFYNFISDVDPNDPTGSQRYIEVGQNNIPTPSDPTRYFRHLDDNVKNGKIDLTYPFQDPRELEWKVKSGLFTSRSERDFTERTFFYRGLTNGPGNPDQWSNQNPFPDPQPPTTPTGGYDQGGYISSPVGNSFYTGEQIIDAAYGMVEIPVLSKVSIVGGVRYETTHLTTTAPAATGLIDQEDLLPAISLTWRFVTNMNVRLSYAETVARPIYREFTYYQSDDIFTQDTIVGNPFLEMSALKNYDIRWEWYLENGGMFSVGGFYKTVEKPIERVSGEVSQSGDFNVGFDKITYLNGPEATLWGIEFEMRHNLSSLDPLLDLLSVGFNFALIESEVDNISQFRDLKLLNTGRDVPTRPLYDQSPYIINADISYDNPRTGSAATLAYYFAAERLYLITGTYDVYEQGAGQLDFQFTQKLSEHFKLKFSAKNIMNPKFIRSYAFADETDTQFVYSSYRKGVTLGLSLSYEY
ncbi:MAG: TonB-dependent receptor [Verrucomicrobiota bacterium]|nr:TonB-dependent receptor [Verrucomicrobiota bacterium]